MYATASVMQLLCISMRSLVKTLPVGGNNLERKKERKFGQNKERTPKLAIVK
jgi:hypothetical protein